MMKHIQHGFYLLFFLIYFLSCNDQSVPTSSSSEPPPLYDEDGLLTDAGMVTEEDPNAPQENENWVEWIKENSIPVRSLDVEIFTDLQALIPFIGNRKYIQLGESGHGVAEFNSAKVRLIKFLHQQLGFDVIAFESSIFGCFYANEHLSEFSASDLMNYSIFQVWHTYEVEELFTYLKRCAETDHPLILAGFDTQISGWMSYDVRPLFYKDIISRIDPTYANQVYQFDDQFIWNHFNEDYLISNQDQLINQYTTLFQFFDDHQAEFAALYQENLLIPLVARQTAWSMTRYIQQLAYYFAENSFAGTEMRDEGMADNFDYLITHFYPDKKIVLWAHNFHIRHNNSATPNYAGLKTMGTYICQRHRDDLYTVGLYMYRGQAAWNTREVYTVEAAQSGSLESVFYRARKKYCFVDMLGQEMHSGNNWMFFPSTAKEWGTYDMQMIIRNQYDAILFVDTVHPPDYVEYSFKNSVTQQLNALNRQQ